jgi:hypothetical protein
LWTTRLLARHVREHGPREGHACLGKLVQGTLCIILNEQEIKPHKVRYYLERRDPDFKAKMAEVLCVYREVKIIKETATKAKQKPSDAVAIISYDEKPGIQAIATTAPDLPPEPGSHATFARDHEYKRHGTVSLLAGIDLLTGQVHALVKDRHRSREFIEFLKLIDAAYPAHTVPNAFVVGNELPSNTERSCASDDEALVCGRQQSANRHDAAMSGAMEVFTSGFPLQETSSHPCLNMLMSLPSGSLTKKRRTPQGSVVGPYSITW